MRAQLGQDGFSSELVTIQKERGRGGADEREREKEIHREKSDRVGLGK
jgi:hypothetical protein